MKRSGLSADLGADPGVIPLSLQIVFSFHILSSFYSSTCHGRSLGWTATCFGRPLLRCTNYFAMLKYLHQTATCLTRPADSIMLACIPAKAAIAMAHFKSEQVSGPGHNTLVWLGDVEWNDFVVWTMPSTRQLSTTMTGRLPWSPRRMAMCLMIRTVLTKKSHLHVQHSLHVMPWFLWNTCWTSPEQRTTMRWLMQLLRWRTSWRFTASSRLPVQGKPPCSSFSSASWLGVSYSQACIQYSVCVCLNVHCE